MPIVTGHSKGIALQWNIVFQWDITKTQQSSWLGGYKKNGENVSSEDHLKQTLVSDFKLLDELQIVSDYHLDSRNSQLARNHVTVWQKRD